MSDFSGALVLIPDPMNDPTAVTFPPRGIDINPPTPTAFNSGGFAPK